MYAYIRANIADIFTYTYICMCTTNVFCIYVMYEDVSYSEV
jgi:hypothetical protein